MLTRSLSVLFLALALAGCQESKPSPSSFISGSQDVAVDETRVVFTGDSNSQLGGQAIAYLICKVTFTNDLGEGYTPRISNFVLQDPSGTRYQAYDSGSTALVGISNYGGSLKKDEQHQYTIAFRVQPNITGKVYYAP